MYGGVDSWLLYKLTGNHITEVSSMSAVGYGGGWIFLLSLLLFQCKKESELKTNNGRARDQDSGPF